MIASAELINSTTIMVHSATHATEACVGPFTGFRSPRNFERSTALCTFREGFLRRSIARANCSQSLPAVYWLQTNIEPWKITAKEKSGLYMVLQARISKPSNRRQYRLRRIIVVQMRRSPYR